MCCLVRLILIGAIAFSAHQHTAASPLARGPMQFNDGGEVRGEALYTFVCYPSSSAKCRLTNFKQSELELAHRTLAVFQEMGKLGVSDRDDLMNAGACIRNCL